jgi:exosome complex component RRP45
VSLNASDLRALTMPREVEPSQNERSFILEALRENIRLDGRALDAFRDLELTFGEEYGSANVQLGRTR